MVKMTGGNITGGNITPLSGADITNITSVFGSDFKPLAGSGNPMQAAADIGVSKMVAQVAVDMNAGGQKGGSSITVDCPSVVGATPQQQASTCALFRTGAETSIQTRLFNQGGGKRRNKTRNKHRQKKRTLRKRVKRTANKRVKRTANKRVKRTANKRVKRTRNTRGVWVRRRRKLSR